MSDLNPKKKRENQKKDLILFDFEGKINNKEFKGVGVKDETVVLGSKKYIPGYEEQMENLEIGQESELNVVFPDDYREKKSGKQESYV